MVIIEAKRKEGRETSFKLFLLEWSNKMWRTLSAVTLLFTQITFKVAPNHSVTLKT